MEEDKDLVLAASFENAIEAHSFRIRLAEVMVPATVNDDTSGFGLGAKVYVRRIDAEQARDVLQHIENDKVPRIPAWRCECGAQVDEGFAVCWSCEKNFDSVAQMQKLVGADAHKETHYESKQTPNAIQLDPETEDPSVVYSTMIRAIVPRPIAWVSTISEGGITNLAPFSYFNGICSQPAALMFSAVNRADGSKKDTVCNIEATGQFVVNVVPYELREAMLSSSQEYDFEESEFEKSGMTPLPGVRIQAPRVAESPIQFECELHKIVPVGDGPLAANVIIGKILLVHISKSVLNAEGKIDPELLDAVGRMGGRDYTRTKDRFSLP